MSVSRAWRTCRRGALGAQVAWLHSRPEAQADKLRFREPVRLRGGRGAELSSVTASAAAKWNMSCYLVEELVLDSEGSCPPTDYKFFMMGGRVLWCWLHYYVPGKESPVKASLPRMPSVSFRDCAIRCVATAALSSWICFADARNAVGRRRSALATPRTTSIQQVSLLMRSTPRRSKR